MFAAIGSIESGFKKCFKLLSGKLCVLVERFVPEREFQIYLRGVRTFAPLGHQPPDICAS